MQLVSVIIPSYNHDLYIRETIQSVINQDYENIELIIIDDGSKDNSISIIEEMIPACKKRFKRFEFRARPNIGLSKTLNESLSWVNGEFISPVASDDILLSNKISTLMAAIEKNKSIDVIFGDARFIDKKTEELELSVISPITLFNINVRSFLLQQTASRFNYKDESIFGTYESLLDGNYLPAMSCLIRTTKLIEVDGWDENISIEDWGLWLKLSKVAKFSLIDEEVALYRIHGKNSDDLIRPVIAFDAYYLLKNEKNYALNLGFKNKYYKNLAARVYSLRKTSSYSMILELFKGFHSLTFVKCLFFHVLFKLLVRLFK